MAISIQLPHAQREAISLHNNDSPEGQSQDRHPEPSAELDALAPRFEALGLSEIAARLRALSEPAAPVEAAPVEAPPFPAAPEELGPADLLTIEAAAAALGLHSASVVRTLADMGKLQAYWNGNDVLLSRESVESYACSPIATTQRRLEEQLLAILETAADL